MKTLNQTILANLLMEREMCLARDSKLKADLSLLNLRFIAINLEIHERRQHEIDIARIKNNG